MIKSPYCLPGEPVQFLASTSGSLQLSKTLNYKGSEASGLCGTCMHLHILPTDTQVYIIKNNKDKYFKK